MGYQINFIQTTPQDCAYFMNQVTPAITSVATLCANYDFSDLTTLRMFVNGSPDMKNTWTELATTLEITQAQMLSFYTVTNSDPYGDGTNSVMTGSFADVLLYV